MHRNVPYFFLLFLILMGCATHPTVSTTPMAKGETRYGYTLALENVFPYAWYRYAVSDVSNVGLRIGLPIYGTGLDYSRLLFSRENKRDILNVAWSVNPNYNLDVTYYRIRQKKARSLWWGLRGMYIPKGLTGGTSTRIGYLIGFQPGNKYGFEFGYFHDFGSMPITKVFQPGWRWDDPENVKRFGDKPHVDPASGFMPSEYSRLTGLSLQFFVNLSPAKSNQDSDVQESGTGSEKN